MAHPAHTRAPSTQLWRWTVAHLLLGTARMVYGPSIGSALNQFELVYQATPPKKGLREKVRVA